MAKKPESDLPSGTSVIELQVQVNPRGRSVVNGTLLLDGEMRTIKHELSISERSEIERLMISFLVRQRAV
jgi:hypothetical protein